MKWTDSLKRALKKLGKEQFLIIIMAGVLLVIIAFPSDQDHLFDETGDTKNKELIQMEGGELNVLRSATQEPIAYTEEEYVKRLEARLKQLLSYCSGCGEVEVMITLNSKSEKVVEKDTHTIHVQTIEEDGAGGTRKQMESEQNEASIYTSTQNGTDAPLVVKEKLPQIEGVVIIAKGGDDPVVKSNITQAVQALFSIEAHKIKIIKMK
ncbi:MAG: stage III sporulation protein AG [Clostridia bacterium]|nr:stage III sporulation protein AG [Clostridia bacterium]